MKKVAVVHPIDVFNATVSRHVKKHLEKRGEEVIIHRYKTPGEMMNAFKEYKELFEMFGEPDKRVFDFVYVQHTCNNIKDSGSAQILNQMAEDGFDGYVGILGLNENERNDYNGINIDYGFSQSIPSVLKEIKSRISNLYD